MHGCVVVVAVCVRVLHGRASARGPGRPAAHGPGRAAMIFCGPGRAGPVAGLKLAGPGRARAGK